MTKLEQLMRKRGWNGRKSKHPCGNPTCQGYTIPSGNKQTYRRCPICSWRSDVRR